MKIETFEVIEEGIEGKIDNYEEIKKIVDELKLEGQKKFLNGEKKDVFPYRRMTGEELFVYRELCPIHVPIKRYDASIIPLRVLQVAVYVEELDFLDLIEVWYHGDCITKDPVLVGIRKRNSETEHYLLARWGEELKPFEELKKLAKEVARERILNNLNRIKAEVEADIQKIDVEIEKAMKRGNEISASYYGL